MATVVVAMDTIVPCRHRSSTYHLHQLSKSHESKIYNATITYNSPFMFTVFASLSPLNPFTYKVIVFYPFFYRAPCTSSKMVSNVLDSIIKFILLS